MTLATAVKAVSLDLYSIQLRMKAKQQMNK